MHVNGDASLQVGTLDLGELTAEGDHDHLTQDGLCLLHVLGHDRLVGPGKCEGSLQHGKCEEEQRQAGIPHWGAMKWHMFNNSSSKSTCAREQAVK